MSLVRCFGVRSKVFDARLVTAGDGARPTAQTPRMTPRRSTKSRRLRAPENEGLGQAKTILQV